jgi:gluconolactonase
MITGLKSGACALSLAVCFSLATVHTASAQDKAATPSTGSAALPGAPAPEHVQPWGLPPPPPDIGPVSLFADIHNTPQGKFLEGGAFDKAGNFWFVDIGTGWVAYLTPEGKLVPGFNCDPQADIGILCEPQGTRWHDGKLYVPTRHLGILVYDPETKHFSSLVSTYRNQLFKGPNDLDFDAEGNLYFTDPWGTGPGPDDADRAGAVYQYSATDKVLRRVISTASFPNGIAVSPDDGTLAVADYASNRMLYYTFLNGPIPPCTRCAKDPSHQTFFFATAGSYNPGNGGPDGIHYDVHGNLWAALGIGGVMEYDRRGVIIGYVPIPNGDVATNFAFGGENNQYIYVEGCTTGTIWRFKTPYPGLIGPGGERLPPQH